MKIMRMNKSRRLAGSFFWVCLSWALFSCGREKSGDKTEAKKEPGAPSGQVTLTEEGVKLAGIKMEKITIRSIPVEFSAPGEVGFNEKKLVQIPARVSGWVEKVYAFPGDRVTAGESLAAINSPEFLSVQSEFIQADERLKSVSDPVERRTAEALFGSARSRLLLFGADEREATALTESHQPVPRLIIKSPIAGSVVESNASEGTRVEKGANLLRISDLSTLWVSASVYEKDIRAVQKGEPVKLRVSSLPGRTLAGRVEAVNDVLDAATRTFKVRIAVENSEGLLKPEMFCECLFAGESSRPFLAVPASALQRLGNQQIVFVPAGPNSFEKREVKTGQEIGNYVEILEGLKTGEEVVSEGSFLLKSELLKSRFEEE